MPYTADTIQELNILCRFNLDTTLEGIKVHHDAAPEVIEATQRLHNKGLVTMPDGGYLTDLGRETAEHAQAMASLLMTS
ncbi:TIGR02647 family protein [Corallincola luteus]|uniref:TIGR02647 family protein n=1 Tax=Corallincola luteus TaxID=1775177 RepID=A0ABY2AHW6_9GAMM|nr:TIGR02647 family protein [Corallincola luteus]TCI01647.1 TIGR02647 family protein [Corallincola luteus]